LLPFQAGIEAMLEGIAVARGGAAAARWWFFHAFHYSTYVLFTRGNLGKKGKQGKGRERPVRKIPFHFPAYLFPVLCSLIPHFRIPN
jgi:hypothetical protein